MSQYEILNKLLQAHNELREDAVSFYNSIHPVVRKVLAEWIENQNWSALLSADSTLTESEVQAKASDLLEEALRLLQTGTSSSPEGSETLLFTHAEASLRNAYHHSPLQFVRDINTCLCKELDLIARMSQQNYHWNQKTMGGPNVQTSFSYDQLNGIFQSLLRKVEETTQSLEWLVKLVDLRRTEIESRSPEKIDLFGGEQIHDVPFQAFHTLKKAVMDGLSESISRFSLELPKLSGHIKLWRTHQLCQEVCIRPKHDTDVQYVEDLCENVFQILSILFRCVTDERIQKVNSVVEHSSSSSAIPKPSELLTIERSLKQCINQLVNMCLVVFDQPPMTMIIEKVTGTPEVNCSKKFKTSVGLLGGSVLEGVLDIAEVDIILMFREDIAGILQDKSVTASRFPILKDQTLRRRSSDQKNPDFEQKCCMRIYENVRVDNFTRREQKNVYRQICHAIYLVKFESPSNGWKFQARTLSLPIVVRTGANQASEHKGAQLWYGFSIPDVYDVMAPVASELPLDEVVKMMDERIRFIGGRGLQDYEKKFLHDKLGRVAKSGKGNREPKDKISLDGFIKDKVQLKAYCPGVAEDTTSFSLWRWFHSIINLLEGELRCPWIDGVIYGFASREQCERALQKESPGACLIRFSESLVEGNHENSKGKIGVVLKTAEGVHYAPPISSEKVSEHGLSVMIRNIKVNERIPEILLPARCTMHDLKKYDPARDNEKPPVQDKRYSGFAVQVVTIKTAEMSIGSPASDGMPFSPTSISSATPRKTLTAKKRSRGGHSTPAGGCKQKCNPPESPESTASSMASQDACFPSSPTSHFCAVGLQTVHNISIDPANGFQFSNIPATVSSMMEIDAYDHLLNQPDDGSTQQASSLSMEDWDILLPPEIENFLKESGDSGIEDTHP